MTNFKKDGLARSLIQKVVPTLLLMSGLFVAVVLALITLPSDTLFSQVWQMLYLLTAVAFVLGIVACWRSQSTPKLTYAAMAWGLIVYLYILLLAPLLPEPFGFLPTLP